MAAQDPVGNWCWGGGATHGLAIRFAGINYKGSFMSRCALVSFQALLFVGLLITGFVLYAQSTYWTRKSFPLLYDYDTNNGHSESRFVDWNAALAFGILGAIGTLGVMWEYLAAFSGTPHPVERVSTRWSTVLIDSFITPLIVVTLLVEVGDLSIWNLIAIFFLHHISTLINYMVEYDGQTKTSKSRLMFDRNVGLFVSLLASLPIFFSWPAISTLNNTVISAAVILLVYGFIDCVINYMYVSSLCMSSMPGSEWFKSANEASRKALMEQANMDNAGLLVTSSAPRIEDDREEILAVVPTHAKNILNYYRFFTIKSTVSPVFKFVAAMLLLFAPVTDSSVRRAEMSRIYSHLCDSDTDPSVWHTYGFERDSCMLNGVLCNYVGDQNMAALFQYTDYDLMYNRNPFQTYGVDNAAVISITTNDVNYPRALQSSTVWRSTLNNGNSGGGAGMIFGNDTAFFLCNGSPVSGCNGVSKCPAIGWSNDQRAFSDAVRGSSRVTMRDGVRPAAPFGMTGDNVFAPTPTATAEQRRSWAPINCDDSSLINYVGVDRPTGSICIQSGWGLSNGGAAVVSRCLCTANDGKFRVMAGDPSEGWIDATCSYDLRCSMKPNAPNY